MPWLRIDDGFTRNSKIAQLTDSEFRVWMRLLCHCAGSRDPSVDGVSQREVSGLTRARIQRFADLGLIDRENASYLVHDWLLYQPKDATNAERQARWRAKNGVSRAVTREVTSTVTSTGPETVTEPSRAGAGTRGDPSRPVQKEPDLLQPSVRTEPSTNARDPHGRTDGSDDITIPTIGNVIRNLAGGAAA